MSAFVFDFIDPVGLFVYCRFSGDEAATSSILSTFPLSAGDVRDVPIPWRTVADENVWDFPPIVWFVPVGEDTPTEDNILVEFMGDFKRDAFPHDWKSQRIIKTYEITTYWRVLRGEIPLEI